MHIRKDSPDVDPVMIASHQPWQVVRTAFQWKGETAC